MGCVAAPSCQGSWAVPALPPPRGRHLPGPRAASTSASAGLQPQARSLAAGRGVPRGGASGAHGPRPRLLGDALVAGGIRLLLLLHGLVEDERPAMQQASTGWRCDRDAGQLQRVNAWGAQSGTSRRLFAARSCTRPAGRTAHPQSGHALQAASPGMAVVGCGEVEGRPSIRNEPSGSGSSAAASPPRCSRCTAAAAGGAQARCAGEQSASCAPLHACLRRTRCRAGPASFPSWHAIQPRHRAQPDFLAVHTALAGPRGPAAGSRALP